jgi:peroxisomal 2,4-dienoyl-CoA reductase
MSKEHHRVVSYFRPDALAGRAVLVTGGGSGIGFEIARQFGLHGAKGVVLMGRRQAFLDEAVKLLAADGIKAVAAAGDIRKPEDCAAAVARSCETFGSLDVLINSAAGNFLSPAEELSPKGFKTVVDIDLQGAYNMIHASFEALKSSKFGGVITSITSTLHYTATWYQVAPVAAKAAIDAMTKSIALEWGEFGIRCNTVAPGPVEDTPGLEKLSGGNWRSMRWDHIPSRRASTKQEVASSCLYLCLNEIITGHMMVVDGGEWFGKQPFIPREQVTSVARGVEKSSRSMGPASASKL